MKILILTNYGLGLYKFRRELIQKFLQQGNEVLISLPDSELVRKLEQMGCCFIDTLIDRRGINPLTDIRLMRKYKTIIKNERPNLAITYTIKPNIYGGLMCRLFNLPYVVNITGLGTAFEKPGALKMIVIALYKLSLKKAKIVFFENQLNQQEFIKLGIIKNGNGYVLNGAGVNLEEYAFSEYPPFNGNTIFLFIGRIMREKGIDELLEVATRMKQEKMEVHINIIGPMEDDYKGCIEELSNKGVIVYHGYHEDVKPFIRACHCFVLPSYHEGMANTNLECASMGRPLITSDIPGCREAVLDGRTGLLCTPGSADSLYEKMKEFCEMSWLKKEEMGRNARKLMELRFDRNKIIEETVEQLW